MRIYVDRSTQVKQLALMWAPVPASAAQAEIGGIPEGLYSPSLAVQLVNSSFSERQGLKNTVASLTSDCHIHTFSSAEKPAQGCGHRSMPRGHRYCLELVLRRHTLSHWACSQCLFHSLDLKTHIFLKGKLLVNTSFGKQKHTHFLRKSAFWYLCFATNITIIWKSPSGVSSFRTGFVLCTYLNLPSCEVVWADPLQRVI